MAVEAYRGVLRAARKAFQGDARIYSAAIAQAHSKFSANRHLTPEDPETRDKIAEAREVARILRENVVQGESHAGGKQFTSVLTLPSPSQVIDPQSLIPSTFFANLAPLSGPGLSKNGLFKASLALAGEYAPYSYDALFAYDNYAEGGDATILIKRVLEKRYEFSTKLGLWTTYRCLQAMVRTRPSTFRHEWTPARCSIGMQPGTVLAAASYSRKKPFLLSAADTCTKNSIATETDGKLIPHPQTDINDDGIAVLRQRTPSISNTSSCTDDQPNANIIVSTDLGPIRGPRNEPGLPFTLLEAAMQLAATTQPNDVVPPDWTFEYASAEYGYSVALTHPWQEQQPLRLVAWMAVKGLLKAGQGRDWGECDFQIWVRADASHMGMVMLEGKVRKV